MNGLRIVSRRKDRQSGWRLLVKKAIDRTTAALLLLLLCPLLLLIALAVRVSMGSPVLFRQRRPGHYGRPFELVKFRTMRDASDGNGRPLGDSERLTSVGRLLRSLSLDELPQLWNVLKGELSLVGPRPLLMEYLPRYTRAQTHRHDALPGITGWAQVNGRNALTWEQKFELDAWYVDHWSIALDLRILLATFTRVLQRDGISQPGHDTMPEFLGVRPRRNSHYSLE